MFLILQLFKWKICIVMFRKLECRGVHNTKRVQLRRK